MRTIFFFPLIIISTTCISQERDSIFEKQLNFSTSITQALINELSLYIDYRTGIKKSFGINGGYIYYNNLFHDLPLSPRQDDFPGTVYSGFVSRFYMKIYFKKKPNRYFSPQFIFKKIAYNNKRFFDMFDGEHDYAEYTRSEKAMVAGLDFLIGTQSRSNRDFFDFYYGIGMKCRYREYTTHTSKGTYSPHPEVPIGSFSRTQLYPTLSIGLKISYNTKIKD